MLFISVRIPKGWIAAWRRHGRPGSPRSRRAGKREQERAACVASSPPGKLWHQVQAQGSAPGIQELSLTVLWPGMSSSHGFLSTSPHPQKKEKKKSQKNPSPIWRIKCLGGNPSSAESGGKAPSTSPGKNFQVLSAPEL